MKVLAWGDTHLPFIKEEYLDFIWDIFEEEKPDRIVHIGDLTDQYIFSRYPKKAEAHNVERELRRAKEFIKDIGEMFPKMDLIMGNHDQRYQKRVEEAHIPLNFMKGFGEIFELPKGWKLHEDCVVVDGVYYYHGHLKGGMTPALAMAKTIGQSVVCGHLHTIVGLNYASPLGKPFFGLDLPCGIDYKKYAFHFYKESLNKPIIGCGVIEDGKRASLRLKEF